MKNAIITTCALVATVALASEPAVPSEVQAELRGIAGKYLKAQLVNPRPYMAPTQCSIPPTAVLYSDADSDKEHGRKLFYLFAGNAMTLRAKETVKAQPAGQYLVKETWEAVDADDAEKRTTGRHASGHFLSNTAVHKGKTVAIGKPMDLYIMLKQDEVTEDNDEGWIYAVVSRDAKTIHKAGRIQSCIDCHEDADHDRILGDYSAKEPTFKDVPKSGDR